MVASNANSKPNARKLDAVAGSSKEGKAGKRRKVNHACVHCRRSHVRCDGNRPCARCIKRDIGGDCYDEVTSPRKQSSAEASNTTEASIINIHPPTSTAPQIQRFVNVAQTLTPRRDLFLAPPAPERNQRCLSGVSMSDPIEMQEITLRAVLKGLVHLVIPPGRLTTLDSSHIGSGGYGEVILAKLDESEPSAREVAVKQLRTVGTNGVQIRVALRLARELKIWAKVNHPNILGLIGYYLSENYEIAQLVSPFMVNGNVLKYIAELRPDMTKRLDFVRDITTGMGYLHNHDPPICHGDLKPANVLINNSARAVLCDFGLASIADEAHISSGLTTSHSLKGSTRYMSPELVMGKETKQTLASDIWAWACTVFQVLTDVEPYSGAMRECTVIAAIVQKKPPTDLALLSTGVLGKHIEELRIPLPDHLGGCFSYEPTERPPIADSLRLVCIPQHQPEGTLGTVAGVPQTFLEEKTSKLNEVWDALKQHPKFEESNVDGLCCKDSRRGSRNKFMNPWSVD